MKRLIIFLKDIMQYIYEQIVSKKTYGRYIFMFHMVSDDKSRWYDERYSISMKNFKHLINCMREMGFEFVSIKEFMINDGKKKILLTFDDVYKEVYDNVFPYLKSNKLPFVVFQTWNYLQEKEYLKECMLEEMLQYEGCELGSHGLEHLKYSEMKRKESLSSLLESKRRMEKRFGIEVNAMAFPYGSVSAVRIRDQKNVRKAGYEFAFGTVNKGVGKRIFKKFYLPRVNVNDENVERIVERCRNINEC